jgi:hypothetical protein
MKTNLILTLGTFLLMLGCNNPDDNGEDSAYLGDILLSFSVQNSAGDDLLNPVVDGSLNTNSIRYYEKLDGEYVLFNDSSLAYPDGYVINQHNQLYRFTPYYTDHRPYKQELRIDWGNGDSDFIVVNLKDGDGDWRVATEVLFNGDVVWEMNVDADDRFFTIIKD